MFLFIAVTVGVDNRKNDKSRITKPKYMKTMLTDVPMYLFDMKYNPVVGTPKPNAIKDMAGKV